MAGREGADPCGQFAVNPYRDEVTEGPVIANDAQCPVAGAQQLAGGLNDTLQDGVETQILRDCHDRFKQAAHSLLELEEFAGPGDEILQQIFNPRTARSRVPFGTVAISMHIHNPTPERVRPLRRREARIPLSSSSRGRGRRFSAAWGPWALAFRRFPGLGSAS